MNTALNRAARRQMLFADADKRAAIAAKIIESNVLAQQLLSDAQLQRGHRINVPLTPAQAAEVRRLASAGLLQLHKVGWLTVPGGTYEYGARISKR